MINTDDLYIVMTCSAFPEQCNIYLSDRKTKVGYTRLRFGDFTVDYPDCGEKTVYEYEFDNEWKGSFDNEEEAAPFYEKALQAIVDAYNEDHKEETV